MKNSDFRSHGLTRREVLTGFCWLIFETLLFSELLQGLNNLLPTALPQSEINFLFFAGNLGAVVLIFRKYLWQQLRLAPELWGSIVFTVLPGFAAYWLANFLITQVILVLDPGFASVNDMTIQTLVRENYSLMLIGTVIFVPIAEECLFRGLAFRGLYDRSPVLAWIFSVSLFSAVHIIGYIGAYPFSRILLCFIQYIPAGICLALTYRLSGSLLSPILIHALVNLMGMIALR